MYRSDFIEMHEDKNVSHFREARLCHAAASIIQMIIDPHLWLAYFLSSITSLTFKIWNKYHFCHLNYKPSQNVKHLWQAMRNIWPIIISSPVNNVNSADTEGTSSIQWRAPPFSST